MKQKDLKTKMASLSRAIKHRTGKKYYIIGAGFIGGTSATSFYQLSEDGKIGFYLDRIPTQQERKQMLFDLERHRYILLQELNDLETAEIILKNQENNL